MVVVEVARVQFGFADEVRDRGRWRGCPHRLWFWRGGPGWPEVLSSERAAAPNLRPGVEAFTLRGDGFDDVIVQHDPDDRAELVPVRNGFQAANGQISTECSSCSVRRQKRFRGCRAGHWWRSTRRGQRRPAFIQTRETDDEPAAFADQADPAALAGGAGAYLPSLFTARM